MFSLKKDIVLQTFKDKLAKICAIFSCSNRTLSAIVSNSIPAKDRVVEGPHVVSGAMGRPMAEQKES